MTPQHLVMAPLFALLLGASPTAWSAQAGNAAPSSKPDKAVEKMVEVAALKFVQGQYADAAIEFEKVVAAEPRNILAWHFLGQSRANNHDEAGALQAYQKVLEIQSGGHIADRTRQMMSALPGVAVYKVAATNALKQIQGKGHVIGAIERIYEARGFTFKLKPGESCRAGQYVAVYIDGNPRLFVVASKDDDEITVSGSIDRMPESSRDVWTTGE